LVTWTQRQQRPPPSEVVQSLKLDYLSEKPLTPGQIDRLSNCIASKSVKRGAAICAKGDPGTWLFAILAAIRLPSSFAQYLRLG
jgi:hypothetical protein